MHGSDDPKVEALRAIPLFAGVNDRHLRYVADLMDLRPFRDDEMVMLEHYHGEQFVIIVDGEAEVLRDGEHVATLGAGSFFGEIGLLTGEDRNATVRARTKLKVLTLDRDGFAALRRELPEVAERIDVEARRRAAS